jgi:hypothetical protein
MIDNWQVTVFSRFKKIAGGATVQKSPETAK